MNSDMIFYAGMAWGAIILMLGYGVAALIERKRK